MPFEPPPKRVPRVQPGRGLTQNPLHFRMGIVNEAIDAVVQFDGASESNRIDVLNVIIEGINGQIAQLKTQEEKRKKEDATKPKPANYEPKE